MNTESQHDAYSRPVIDNLLQKQQGKRIFSVLDLKQGYHQTPPAKSSKDATATTTPLGLMGWKVMPIGVRNRSAQFQRMTQAVIRHLDFADPFLNDIIVSSGTPEMADDELIEAHFGDVCQVLHVVHKHQLTCNGAKAVLFATEVEFAGQVVSHGIRHPIPRKLVPSPTGNDPNKSRSWGHSWGSATTTPRTFICMPSRRPP